MKYPKMAHPQALKNYEFAIIEEAKLVGYSLNPAHPVGGHKARVFQSALGFNQENWRESEIRTKLPYYPATKLDETSFGTKFSVYLPITGPNLRTVEVLTVWQYDKDIEGNEPNFSFKKKSSIIRNKEETGRWSESKLLGQTPTPGGAGVLIPAGVDWYVQPVNNNLTDEDLYALVAELKQRSIPGLNLSECGQITDAGLANLKELKGLTMLNLYHTQITDAGLKELRSALPKCKIDF